MTKPTQKPFFYPVTYETLHEYAQKVFTPIKMGQCATIQFYPRGGKRTWNKFLINNLKLFKQEFPEQKNFLLFYLDPIELTEESPFGYFQLLYSLIKKETAPMLESYREVYKAIKVRVDGLLKEGKEVVFFLGKFDELGFMSPLFANNLKAIWDIDKRKIHFVFLVTNEALVDEFLENLDELSEAIMQNLDSVPLLSEKDVDYSIKRQEETSKFTFSESEKKAIKEIGHGHPYIVKLACLLIASNKPKNPGQFLKSQYQMEYLKNLIQKKEKNLEVNKEGQLLIDGQPIKPIFSAREYELLREFFKEQDRLLSRDKIAEILWGEKESYEKYSDWAISQAIATLRKKLSSIGVGPASLKPIRGEGYVFTQRL
jgi:DNA-binding winged helix-turn-helix (wHTH) protein